ncbi:hypothetical protein ACE10Z_34805 [Bradyrhizobium sp. Pha-3]|uniref:hypothetical protein n=1 Tax=Bradyrhizobium sp. Pha-3 TaxID=208375 RepID=UPI0035D50601
MAYLKPSSLSYHPCLVDDSGDADPTMRRGHSSEHAGTDGYFTRVEQAGAIFRDWHADCWDEEQRASTRQTGQSGPGPEMRLARLIAVDATLMLFMLGDAESGEHQCGGRLEVHRARKL